MINILVVISIKNIIIIKLFFVKKIIDDIIINIEKNKYRIINV